MSKQGIRANLQGVAIVKVGGTEDAIRAAAQRFLHQQAEIDEFTREVLAGALRSIVGRLTIEEIIRDRAAFASRGRRGGRALDDQPGSGARHVPAAGHPRRGLVPAGPRPARGGPGAQGRGDRRGARPAGRPSRSGCSPRRRSPRRSGTWRSSRPRIQAEIDAAKARSAAAGPLAEAERAAGHPRRAAEGRRAQRRAQAAPARHRGAQAGRRGALQGRAGGRGRPQRGGARTPTPQRQATIAAAQADGRAGPADR